MPCLALRPAHSSQGPGDSGYKTPWQGPFQPQGSELAQEGEEATATLSAAWAFPPGLRQTELNRPAYQLSPPCPTRLSWSCCWESGPQPFARDGTGPGWGTGRGVFPGVRLGWGGVSGKCAEQSWAPRVSAADLLWLFK